jgi:hypothetical protein
LKFDTSLVHRAMANELAEIDAGLEQLSEKSSPANS